MLRLRHPLKPLYAETAVECDYKLYDEAAGTVWDGELRDIMKALSVCLGQADVTQDALLLHRRRHGLYKIVLSEIL